MTNAVSDIASPLGISVHDRIIVGKSGHQRLEELKVIPLAMARCD